MANRKFNRGDAVIHRNEVKSVQGISHSRSATSGYGHLYYTVKGSDCTTTAVRSDALNPALGAW